MDPYIPGNSLTGLPTVECAEKTGIDISALPAHAEGSAKLVGVAVGQVDPLLIFPDFDRLPFGLIDGIKAGEPILVARAFVLGRAFETGPDGVRDTPEVDRSEEHTPELP